ncbi:1-acyl-sn-glycerol-3-phosphate acyltransferase [Bombilactobacillus thymidiniphilus]|uniref:1-acyl-sn-glycerol-3-phosphate acyltransferase n=1 Tax=Bombilactobacillus thymidiniphilus TaxID=2923363 RepID=A0ABY4PCW1_9LACO|nr:1-acyl-sn-glycerol-3-phosphate acyltransferase [Bombilactobacillus thymidiniphilus]UQS83112.1 1-acyl-sn-glycerol-3-phosphate acyltransferase [Bombilactobacillus thymidiniphilus]
MSKKQMTKLTDKHRWIHTNFFYRVISQLFYYVIVIFSSLYCYGWLHLRFRDIHKLRHNNQKGGVVYCNHTQPLGDALLPFIAAFPKRPYIICSQANLGIPIIGHLLTLGGALVIPDGKTSLGNFNKAVKTRLQQKQLVFIYPEAHVWPYFTEIRPFTSASFHYSAVLPLPSFSLTITYQHAKLSRRPKMVVYVDGPFAFDSQLTPKQNQQNLHEQIRSKMQMRSHNSNFKYYNYIQERNSSNYE